MEAGLSPDPEVELLVIGIGNDGRYDDGLGWAFVDALAERGHPPEQLEHRFQLGVEDADAIRRAQSVVFVDATREALPDGFAWGRCEPRTDVSPSSHHLHPGLVLGVCRELYGYEPEAFVLAISGTSWGLHVGLSNDAQANLAAALSFFEQKISG